MYRSDVEPHGNDASQEHTLACLARLDLLLRREALRLRARVGLRPDEDYRGLYVSQADMEHLLSAAPGDGGLLRPVALGEAEEEAFRAALAVVDAQVAASERQSRAAGLAPLLALAARFGLDPVEQAVLLVGLALELDIKYERIFAYLQDDVGKKRPSVDLALRLLCPDAAARVRARAIFEPGRPLRRWSLIELLDEPAQQPLLARPFKLDERIASWLLGSRAPDARLQPCLLPQRGAGDGAARWMAFPVPSAVRDLLDRWEPSEGPSGDLLVFSGRPGTGRRRAAAELADALGRPLLLLDAGALAGPEVETALRRVEREARLTDALVVWVGADALLSPETPGSAERRSFLGALRESAALTVLLLERAWEPGPALEGRSALAIPFDPPDVGARRAIWSQRLRSVGLALPESEISSLAARFRLTGGQIWDAFEHALSRAAVAGQRIDLHMLEAACRAQSQHRLNHLTTRVRLGARWDDLVLPPPQMTLLRAIATTVRHRPTVYGEWGFGARTGAGQGVVA